MLYNFTTGLWTNAADTCPIGERYEAVLPENATSVEEQSLVVKVCHFSMYALFVESAACPSGPTCADATVVAPLSTTAAGVWSSGLQDSIGCPDDTLLPEAAPCGTLDTAGRDVLYRFVAEEAGSVTVQLAAYRNDEATLQVIRDDGLCGNPDAACVASLAVVDVGASEPIARTTLEVQAGDSFLLVVSTASSEPGRRSTRFEVRVALAGSCGDGERNGAEVGVDCGGPSCPRCGNGRDPRPLSPDVPTTAATSPNINVFVDGGATNVTNVLIAVPPGVLSDVVEVARLPINANTALTVVSGHEVIAGEASPLSTGSRIRLPVGSTDPLVLRYGPTTKLAATCATTDDAIVYDSFALFQDNTPVLITVSFVCPRRASMPSDGTLLGQGEVFVTVEDDEGVRVPVPADGPTSVYGLPDDPTLLVLLNGEPAPAPPFVIDDGDNLTVTVVGDECVAGVYGVVWDAEPSPFLVRVVCDAVDDDESATKVQGDRAVVTLTTPLAEEDSVVLRSPSHGIVTVTRAADGEVVATLVPGGPSVSLPPNTEVRLTYTLVDSPCPTRSDSLVLGDGTFVTFAVQCGTAVPQVVENFDDAGQVFRRRTRYYDDDDDEGHDFSGTAHASVFDAEWEAWDRESDTTLDDGVDECGDALATLQAAVAGAPDLTEAQRQAVATPLAEALRQARKARRNSKDAKVVHKQAHAAAQVAATREVARALYPAAASVRIPLDTATRACERALSLLPETALNAQRVPGVVFFPGGEEEE